MPRELLGRSTLAATLLIGVAATTAHAADPQPPITLGDGRITISGLMYVSWDSGEIDGEDVSDFFVDRAYLTTEAQVLPFLSARVTIDTSQDLEGDGRGDMEVRLKYAYAKFRLGDWRLLRDLSLEAGIVHMVWLDFEEHINLYRMRAPMFMERSGIFNSADFGLTLAGHLGPQLGEEYRAKVNRKYAGRWGSFAVGAYNGSGYHGDERNVDKVIEGRLTIRPLPDALTGLQLSGLAIAGAANQPDDAFDPSDWETYNAMLSYEHARGVATAQYVWGRGNQRGSWVEPDDLSRATPFDGWAVFGEWRFGPHWRVFGGYDLFDRQVSGDEIRFDRPYAGVAYDLGRRNMLVADYDVRRWDDDSRPDDARVRLTLQVRF